MRSRHPVQGLDTRRTTTAERIRRDDAVNALTICTLTLFALGMIVLVVSASFR